MCVVMITKEESSKIVNSMSFETWTRVQECGIYKSYREHALYFTLSIFSTLIATLSRDYNVAFLCYCCFYSLYDGAFDMQI